ncbi:MAG: ABC transporter ATP-binding protein [Actinomycetota bacterium]
MRQDVSGSLLAFRGVTKRYGPRVAVEDVDLDVREGRTLGIVGESGSGKTTCVRLALALERPTSGSIWFRGTPYARSDAKMREVRRRIGFVFQDPYDSLDPRIRIGDVVAEPLRIHGVRRVERLRRAEDLLASVGLPDAPLDSYPSRYSGGGRQRIAIARALSLDPEVLLCDEPTASLDVSVQAQILNLLLELKASRQLSVVFVSHDLDLIRRIADEVMVMYAGRVMETGEADEIHAMPRHPYTVSLLGAVPGFDPHDRKLQGRAPLVSVAEEADDRTGCPFAPRCPRAQDRCHTSRPPLEAVAEGVLAACFFPEVGRVADDAR